MRTPCTYIMSAHTHKNLWGHISTLCYRLKKIEYKISWLCLLCTALTQWFVNLLIKNVNKNLFILLKWQFRRAVTWREAARPTPTSVIQTHWLTYAKSLQQQLKSNLYFKTGTNTSFWFVFPPIFEFWNSNSAREKAIDMIW